MLESLVLGSLLIGGLFLMIRVLLTAQQSIVIDELIEQALICTVSEKSNCPQELRLRLQDLHIEPLLIQLYQTSTGASLRLKARSRFDREFNKESELEIETQWSL